MTEGDSKPAIRVDDLRVQFPIRSAFLRRTTGVIRAVDGVSFEIAAGSTVGLVGESGSGKSTTGRALLGLAPATSGSVTLFGKDLATLTAERGALPRLGQLVFQDPYASLNPRMTIGATLREALVYHRIVSRADSGGFVQELLDSVGLRPELAARFPLELSGGQRQRVAIARALAVQPEFIVLDEVVSALDVSIQGQILNLLMDLQRRRRLTYLFITHDLSVVRHVSNQIVVLYGGKVMEVAARDRLFAAPHHPYTHALLSAVPVPDPQVERGRARIEVRAEPPNPLSPPSGCRFHKSCQFATEECRSTEPVLREVEKGHLVACHHMQGAQVRRTLGAGIEGITA